MHRDFFQGHRWRGVGRLLVACGLVLVLCGCTSMRAPYQGDRAPLLRDVTPAVPDMARALEGAALEWIQVPDKGAIPVRHFQAGHGRCPVVLIHGLQSHSLWFVQSARHLADIGLPVYAMDRRGSGLSQSKRGDARNNQEMVDDVDRVVEHARNRYGTDQVHLVGHCFGAIPVTLYASKYPKKVKSVVLPTPGIHTHSDLSVWQKLKVMCFKIGGGNRYIPVPLELESFTDQQMYRGFIAGDTLALTHATASMYLAIHEARRYLSEHTGDVSAPVFMGFAGRDRISDNEDNTAFFKRLGHPANELIVYDRARHILEYSADRDAFFDDLSDWYRKLDEME